MATNKQIVEEVNEAFNTANLDGLLRHCTDDIHWNIVGKTPIVGKEAITAFMGKMNPDDVMEVVTESIIAEGDRVACTGTMRMQHEGGAPYRGAYADIYRFADSKIAELTSYVVDLKS